MQEAGLRIDRAEDIFQLPSRTRKRSRKEMHRMIRSAPALFVAILLAACGKGGKSTDNGRPGATVCSSALDCAGNQLCVNSSCVPSCHSNAECAPTGLVCDDGVCLSPACGDDGQCASGQVCANGACSTAPAASQVASCLIAPDPAVVRAGASNGIQLKDQVDYLASATGTAMLFTDRAFLALPAANSVTVQKTSRQVTINSDADAHPPTIYRFDLENHARLNWNIWMGPVGSDRAHIVQLPDPSTVDSSLVDPFQDAMGDDGKMLGPQARLLVLQLTGAQTPAGLETFSNLTLDNLGTSLAAFTALQLPIQ